jgi:hypothetical protein
MFLHNDTLFAKICPFLTAPADPFNLTHKLGVSACLILLHFTAVLQDFTLET